ncbi:TMEM165/GDT1 family protein [Methylomicrobium sp. RS1]|uniref:TMEM165/GDT1 family protein n=1 Tax=Candidatus Methylomicrobium oryzae TaxID=2802053 RepID=UPI0019215E7F|nr:TMEM165/GDT1 family protein [Methylomicrobium sp. RS1]MBL1264393.1 TMEM165/GDT1 family protein [Methylomicrobium sp. RS1]
MDRAEQLLQHLSAWLNSFITWFHSLPVEPYLQTFLHKFSALLASGNWRETGIAAATSFALIVTAEIGDKSQLVCMTLASRHKAWPVLLGASAAFALLNTLAVVFGAAIASWLPEYIVAAAVAFLFGAFGIHALRVNGDEDGEVREKSGHGIFFTTFLLITVAEFGDKTQLAVVALSSTSLPTPVWIGSTAALVTTSALGVLAGRTILQKFPLALLHRISGTIFLMLSLVAAYRAYGAYASRFA